MKEAEPILSGQLARITDEALRSCGYATPAEAFAGIDDVLEIARQWASGMLPLIEVRKQTTPQQRYLTARFTKPHPRAFSDMLDALIADDATGRDGYAHATKHGIFTDEDLTVSKAKMDTVDGQVRIRFPQRQPWIRYPDGEHGDQGERAAPFYAKDQDERLETAEKYAGDNWMGAKPSKRRTIVRRRQDGDE